MSHWRESQSWTCCCSVQSVCIHCESCCFPQLLFPEEHFDSVTVSSVHTHFLLATSRSACWDRECLHLMLILLHEVISDTPELCEMLILFHEVISDAPELCEKQNNSDLEKRGSNMKPQGTEANVLCSSTAAERNKQIPTLFIWCCFSVAESIFQNQMIGEWI